MPPKGKSASDIKGMLELDHSEVASKQKGNNSIIKQLNNSIIIESDTKKETHMQKQIYISKEVVAQAEIYLAKHKLETSKHTSFSQFVEQAIKEKLDKGRVQ